MISCLLFVALAVLSCYLFCFLSLSTLPCGPDGWTPSQSLALQLISPLEFLLTSAHLPFVL